MVYPKRHSDQTYRRRAMEWDRFLLPVQRLIPFKKRSEFRNTFSRGKHSSAGSKNILGDEQPVALPERREQDRELKMNPGKKSHVLLQSKTEKRDSPADGIVKRVPLGLDKCPFKMTEENSPNPASSKRPFTARLGKCTLSTIANNSRSLRDTPSSPECRQRTGTHSVNVCTQSESSRYVGSFPNEPPHSQRQQSGGDAGETSKVSQTHEHLVDSTSAECARATLTSGKRKSFKCHELDERRKCIMEVKRGNLTIDEACKRYEISARTYYRWKAVSKKIVKWTNNPSHARRKKYPDRDIRRVA